METHLAAQDNIIQRLPASGTGDAFSADTNNRGIGSDMKPLQLSTQLPHPHPPVNNRLFQSHQGGQAVYFWWEEIRDQPPQGHPQGQRLSSPTGALLQRNRHKYWGASFPSPGNDPPLDRNPLQRTQTQRSPFSYCSSQLFPATASSEGHALREPSRQGPKARPQLNSAGKYKLEGKMRWFTQP